MRMNRPRPRPLFVLILGAAAVAQVRCTSERVQRGSDGHDSGAGATAAAGRAPDPDAVPDGGTPITTGVGGTGVFPGGGPLPGAAGSGSGIGIVPGNVPVGTCAQGFVRCYGICMETAQ